MSQENRPTVEGGVPPKVKDSRVTLGIGAMLTLIGLAAAASWLLGPNALGQDQSSREGQDNAFLFMLAGPLGIPMGLYFLYLAKVERDRAASAQRAQKVRGKVTHLWKESKESPERRYRVGYSAPGATPAFACVPAARFKKLAVGDEVEVLVTDGKSYIDL